MVGGGGEQMEKVRATLKPLGNRSPEGRFHLAAVQGAGCCTFVPEDVLFMLPHLLHAWKADRYGLHHLASLWLSALLSQGGSNKRVWGVPPTPTLPSLAVAALIPLRQLPVGQPLLCGRLPCPSMPGDGCGTADPRCLAATPARPP